MKRLIKKHKYKFTYLLVVLILLLPPICFGQNFVYAIVNIKDVKKVLGPVFSNATFKQFSELATTLKITNCLFLLMFFTIKAMRKYFNIYVFAYMLFITFTQNFAYVEGYGFVISSGSFILMLVTCLIWLFKVKKTHEHVVVNKKFLWLLGIILICLWYPLDKNAQFELTLNPIQHYFSSSMYCFNMPIFFSFLLIFYKDNKGGFYEVLALIGILFGAVAFFVNLTYKTGTPNALMHIPLIVSSLTLFLHSYINRNTKRSSI